MARQSYSFVEVLARAGYGARGAVYCLVGALAVFGAIGSGGQTGGSRSALQSLIDEPYGKVWLAAIALGLFGFALWRAVESLTDADRRGTSWKALGVRATRLVSAGIYLSLAFFAASLALGWSVRSNGDERAAQDWTAWLLAQPFGRWILGLVGLGVIGAGFFFIARGWRGNVTDFLALPADARRWAVPLGRIGFAARGIVFALVGAFLGIAAWQSNSSQAHGLGGALQSLESQPYGWVLLAITAAGLFAFGLFGFVQASYREINVPDMADAKAAVADGLAHLR